MLKTLMVRTTLIAFAWSISVSAYAIADSPKQINVPAGDLVTALETLARQADISVVYQAQQLAGLRTGGVTGSLTPQEAVTKLLQGTKLHLRTDPITGAMLIEPPHTNALSTAGEGSTQSAGEAATDPKTASNDAGKGDAKRSFWDRFRLAQVDQGQTSGSSTVEKQDDQASKKKVVQLEEVIVTGSRIPTVAGQQVLPVRSYTREDIQKSGQTTIADFLNSLPDVSVNSNENALTNTLRGRTTVQLHGLPVGTTLTLLNGRRVETSYNGFFDLSSIPAAAVERVEVLPVGASAIYGADALGGAVNILMRKNFNGFEADGKLGHATGVNDTSADIGWGKSWEKGSISIIGTYQDQGELLSSQRELTATTHYPAGSLASLYDVIDYCSPGNIYSLNGQNLPGLSSPQAGIPAGLSGTPTIQQFTATAGKLNLCNTYAYGVIIPHSQHDGVLLSAHYQFSESMDFFTETTFSHEHVQASANEFSINGMDGQDGYTTLGANNPYNPFGEDVGLSFSGLPQSWDSSENLIRPLIGVRGTLFSDWHYEAAAYLSHDRFEDAEKGFYFNQDALQAVLHSSDPAIALNPFTSSLGTPQALQSLLAGVAPPHQYHLVNQIIDGQYSLRGPLFHLPAGPLQVVLGNEYSREKQDSVNNTLQGDLSLSRNAYAAFTEMRAPLLADHEHPQRSEQLALTLAGRYDHTNDFGGKATWQGGLLWQATETLSLRGSYGISYRAPALKEISGGIASSTGLFAGNDPFRGGAHIHALITVGANPNLKPETGASHTLGLAYSSQALHGLGASLTYFNINISNYIARPQAQIIVNNPDLYPGAVIRGPTTPQDPQGFLGPVTRIYDLYYNFGDLRVAGFDADVSYVMDTGPGRFSPSLAVANIYKWQSALVPGSPLISYVNQLSYNSVGFAPRWKGTAALDWKKGPFSTRLAGRYIGPYKDDQTFMPNSNVLGNFWVFDLNARVEAGQALVNRNQWLTGTYVAVGVVNLFNKEPQFSNGLTPFDTNEVDLRGRFVYAQAGIRW